MADPYDPNIFDFRSTLISIHVTLEFLERHHGVLGPEHLLKLRELDLFLDFELVDEKRPRLVYSRQGLSVKERSNTMLVCFGTLFSGYNLVEEDGRDTNVVVMRSQGVDNRLRIRSRGQCGQLFFGGRNADRVLLLNDLAEVLQIRECETGDLVQQFEEVKLMLQVDKNAFVGLKGSKVKLFFETSQGWVQREMTTHVPRARLLIRLYQPAAFVVSNGRERQNFTLNFDAPNFSVDQPGLRFTHRGTQPCTWARSRPRPPAPPEQMSEFMVAKYEELTKDGFYLVDPVQAADIMAGHAQTPIGQQRMERFGEHTRLLVHGQADQAD